MRFEAPEIEDHILEKVEAKHAVSIDEIQEDPVRNYEQEAVEIEEGEAWLDTDEVVEIEVKKPFDKVIPIRLSSEKWEELRNEARELGIGPTTLARMWVLEKLREVARARRTA